MYNGEDELLEIRLNELSEIVDYFIIGESNYSHSGILKEIRFYEFLNRNQNFANKIVYFDIPYIPTDNPWHFEMGSRKFMYDKLISQNILNNDDVIVHGDLDEIPNKEVLINEIENLDCPVTLLGNYYMFCLDLWGRYPSLDAMIFKNEWIINSPYPLYFYRAHRDLEIFKKANNAGWHFSSVGTPENIAKKFKYFAHCNDFKEEIKTPEFFRQCIIEKRGGIAIDTPKNTLKKVDINQLPKYVIDNKEKFKHLFYNYYAQ